MKTTKAISMMLAALSLGAFGAIATAAEHRGHSTMCMEMAHEPHHVLAMGYHHNLATFAKALHEQTAGGKSVNLEFARAAVAEMRRSFDLMKQQHQQCMQTMSAEMQAKMKGKMEQMEAHEKQLNDQLTALEQEVQLPVPDPKKVSTLASSVLTHLDGMSHGCHGSPGKKMKM